ncbi:MAG: hypothetical protein V4714_19865 [Bacteroidota bacterium]
MPLLLAAAHKGLIFNTHFIVVVNINQSLGDPIKKSLKTPQRRPLTMAGKSENALAFNPEGMPGL